MFYRRAFTSTFALVLTEAMAEAKDCGESLFITYMHVKKVFDTVWHGAMLVSIYNEGIKGILWNIYRGICRDVRSHVKCKRELLREIKEWQGIREEGGLTSTGLYKSIP